MDQITALNSLKDLLDNLNAEDQSQIDYASTFDTLRRLFLNITPRTAPRLQKDLESCTTRSEQTLSQLFDKIDLSDKQLLCSLLKCLHAYGRFRLTQVTYHIDHNFQNVDEDINAIYSPSVEKRKWFDMGPLLPPAGTIGWKGIMNHCLVREEPELSQTCLQLLSLKLHYHAVISDIARFRFCDTQMQMVERNGQRVAEKLFELIRDVALEDERMIGLDEQTFSILKLFTIGEQQATIIDALVQDLFKPFLTQRVVDVAESEKLYRLINNCVMNEAEFQDIFISKLIEHLKSNMIRLKRRHSVETEPENGDMTFRTLIENVDRGERLEVILPHFDQVRVSTKYLQASYISFWLNIIKELLPHRTLTAKNSLKILGVCCFLFVKTIAIPSAELCQELTQVLSRTIECTNQINLDKLFSSCSPQFLIELTKNVYENCANPISLTNVPLKPFIESYLNRYLKCCALKVIKTDPENLIDLVNVICDKNTTGASSHSLQNVCIQTLSRCIEDYKNRMPKKIMDAQLKCARICAKRLYKFVKRNCFLPSDPTSETEENPDMNETAELDDGYMNCDKRALAISSLIHTLSIAIEGQDQEILDCYGNLLLKLFKVVESSFGDAIHCAQRGKCNATDPLDLYLARLVTIYAEHRELVSPYIQCDLLDNLAGIILEAHKINAGSNGVATDAKSTRKTVYTQLKLKLENIKNSAPNRSVDLYQTIINKQYSFVTDQVLGSFNDTVREELSCTHTYNNRLSVVREILTVISVHCSLKTRACLVDVIVSSLEQSDPLDHPKLIYLLTLLPALIPKNARDVKAKSPNDDPFRRSLSRISCALIRHCKAIELGPSIHAYKNPGAHKCNRGLQCCTYASCIKMYTVIFQSYPSKTVNVYMSDAMQVCISANLIQYAKYSARLHGFFIQLATALAGLMKAICNDRKEDEIVRSSMPIFLSAFSLFIRCVIMASDRQKLDTLPRHQINGSSNSNAEAIDQAETFSSDKLAQYEKNLENLARDIGKCLMNISELKVKFVDHAPHLISTYIKDVQRASCPDYIKLHLDEGIFRVFNLVDAFQKERRGEIFESGPQRKTLANRVSGSLFEMIHARLDQASREVFKSMHDNHNKFHRYVGKC